MATEIGYDFSTNWVSKGLVPCNGVDKPCDFNAFMKLISNLISFGFYFCVIVTVGILVWAAFEYITGKGARGKTRAKAALKTASIGFLLFLGAWLIINAVVTPLLDTNVIANPLKSNTN